MNVETEIAELKAQILQLNKAVFVGNGTPSLVSRTTKLETDMLNLKEAVSAIKSNSDWLLKLVGGQIIIALFQYLPRLLALIGH